MNYTLEIYRQMLTSLKRGRASVGLSKAKPLFLISLFDYIPLSSSNVIPFGLNILKEMYKANKLYYAPDCKTPYEVPFYHLHSEPFYDLIWKQTQILTTIRHTPSSKFLRENLLYAKLDDELWDLLKNAETREYLRRNIINRYLTNRQ